MRFQYAKKANGHQEIIELKNGRLIGFAEYGDPNGKPVFYFHGFPGSRLEAGHFHNAAVSHQCRLIGIDRPGMGLSSIDKNRSMLSWASDITNFADCLGIEKFSIVGHSGGAPFVAACAYSIPQKLHGAAIVSGMAPLDHPALQAGMARSQKIVNRAIKTMPWLTTVMMKLTCMLLKNPNKMMEQMVKQLPAVDQLFFRDAESRTAIINSTIEAFRNGVAGPSQEMKLLFKPWGFDLEKIICPVTIWHGALDTQAPVSHATIYAKSIPNAQLHILPNEGHHSLIRNHIEQILKSLNINLRGIYT